MNTVYGIIGVLLAIGVIVWPLAWWHSTKHPQPEPFKFKIARSVTLESLPGGGQALCIDEEPFPWYIERGATIEPWEDLPNLHIVRLGIVVDPSWPELS